MRQALPNIQRDARGGLLTALLFASPVVLVGLSSCGSGSSGDGVAQPAPIGSAATKPGKSGLLDGAAFIVEANQGGVAVDWNVTGMEWGRLVDIFDTVPGPGYDADPLNPLNYESRLVYQDFVIGSTIDTAFAGSDLKWEFSTSKVNGRGRLRISKNAVTEKSLFAQAVFEASSSLDPVDPKGLGPTELPPYTLVPRNAALVVRLDDLVDESTIGLHSTVRVFAGNPPTVPFDARVIADPNFGGVASDGTFRSSRLLIDFTITADELASVGQVVEINGLGLPPSGSSVAPNVSIQFPTRIDTSVSQFALLTNLGGKPLSTFNSGPVDFVSTTKDISWALRSGNLDDDNNGFLADAVRPSIVGVQGMVVNDAVANGPDLDEGAGEAFKQFLMTLQFDIADCALNPQPGDVIQVSPVLSYEVTSPGTVVGTTVVNLQVSQLVGPDEGLDDDSLLGASAQFLSPWRSELGAAKAPCFVRYSPGAGLPPVFQVDPEADVLVRFSEPIDPASARVFESFYIAREADVDARLAAPTFGAPDRNDLILGAIQSSSDGAELRFKPSLPFTKSLAGGESYFLNIFSDPNLGGVSDLAGNAIDAPFEQVEFFIDPAAPVQDTDGWVMRFSSADEDFFTSDPAVSETDTDFRGQILINETLGSIQPRPVERFSLVVDRSVEPIVGAMVPLVTPLETPLSSQGSKAHLLWRYMDVGLPISQKDDFFYNLDIEGVALSPFDGAAAATTFDEFEMRMGHGKNLPDEWINPGPPPFPQFPSSGIRATDSFAENFLGGDNAGPFVVHPRELGYTINSSDVFVASTGMPLLQMPWNRDTAEEDKTFFTWRDTAVQTLGQLDDESGLLLGTGVPTLQEVSVIGDPEVFPGQEWGWQATVEGGDDTPAGVPTPGLPLLMEFRCYPSESIAFNAFDLSRAVNISTQPHFRAFSTGGTDLSGTVIQKDPEAELEPTGGFDTTVGSQGQPTVARDDIFYMGQMDVVIRTSRAYTALIDAEGDPLVVQTGQPYDYTTLIVEPAPADQPVGTSVSFAWRGSSLISLVSRPEMLDAATLDCFGEPAFGNGIVVAAIPPAIPDDLGTSEFPVFPWPNPAWSDSLDGISGQRFVQTRITFVGNSASLVTPTLSTYGLAFYRTPPE